jgi:tubulin polyglutamylase TTLL4
MKCNEFKSIRDYQKVNHFPGSFHFGRKDKLWLNLKYMSLKHGFEVFAHFHPQTFILPQDLQLLKKFWINSEEELVFILKPPASARGQGISIINNYNQIPKSARTKRKQCVKPTLIVQHYITNPCLLYNETKFDLRVYVLITSIIPLRVYVYDDGLVRFASHKYSCDLQNINNQFIHLTNYSVNKNNLNYVSNNDINGQTGNKWTLKTLWRYLNHSCKEVNVENLWNQIIDMIIKTVISCESYILKLVQQNLKSRYSSFELLGFDIMLDNNFKPWLLEVNISPSLRSDSSLDSAVKSQLIKDMFNINGYRIPPNSKKFDNFLNSICFNKHFYSATLNNEEKIKVFISYRLH